MSISTKYKKLYKTLIFLSICGLILPNFYIFAQDKVLQLQDLNEPKEIGQKILEVLKKFPKIIGEVFKEDVLPFWKKIWNWFKENVWLKIVN
ncbi:hypothetical protein AMJ49_03595 [Parcubacteria bacterium DG_74_2]|nr:MAG: hypothetical protein AMJ49_03595 [Parcubacteria bacterium DG_74_2]